MSELQKFVALVVIGFTSFGEDKLYFTLREFLFTSSEELKTLERFALLRRKPLVEKLPRRKFCKQVAIISRFVLKKVMEAAK